MNKEIHCPHYPSCNSCCLKASDPQTFNNASTFFSTQGLSLKLNSSSLWGWRCRAKLAVRGTAKNPQIGLFEQGTHRVVDIPQCHLHHPAINQAAAVLRKWIKEESIPPYQEKTSDGVLRYAQLAVERVTERIQLVLILNKNLDEEMQKKIKALWEMEPSLWHSLWVNLNKRKDNVIFGKEWVFLKGEEWLWDRFCERDVCFHPASFAQANPEMFEQLLKQIQEKVPQQVVIVEFYAGVGVISLTLADKARRLYCVEIAPFAQQCFERSQQKLPQEAAKKMFFTTGTASSQIHLLQQAEVIIVDPPRKGLDPVLLKELCRRTTAKQLIYVSCYWKSFLKDSQALLEAGWSLTSGEAFLFFPGSEQIEILGIFNC